MTTVGRGREGEKEEGWKRKSRTVDGDRSRSRGRDGETGGMERTRKREGEGEGERNSRGKGGLAGVNATGWHYAACPARPSMHIEHIPMMIAWLAIIVISFVLRYARDGETFEVGGNFVLRDRTTSDNHEDGPGPFTSARVTRYHRADIGLFNPPPSLAASFTACVLSRSLSLSLVPPTRCRERSPRDACELKIPRLASPVPRISIRFYANVLALAICSFNKRSLNRARFGITLFPV